MSRGERIFRRLLRLFPAEFRGDFGDDMTRTFKDHHDEVTARGGVMTHARLWLDTVLGILMTAPREHWDLLHQDIRYGVRSLRRNPAFTTVALLALGLGVGATTAVFSVVNSVLLQPLPYRSSDRLVRLIENVPARESAIGRPERLASMATDEFTDWRNGMRTLSHMGMYAPAAMTLTDNGSAVRLRGTRVSSSIFPMLGLRPAMGRLFEPGEESRGADAVVLVAHRAWQRHLGSDPSILGRRLTLDGRAYSIVGVMGADLSFPDRETDFWIPFVPLDPQVGRVMRAAMIARLADDATIESAAQEANATGQPLRPPPRPPLRPRPGTETGATTSAKTDASTQADPMPPRFEIVRVHDQLVAPVRPALRMLMFASAAVLLIACANVANLLLARNTTRQREMAIRGALGASRIRLARQALTEHFVLALAGWGVGLVLAYGGVSLVATLAATQGPSWLANWGGASGGNVLPRVDDLAIDGAVLAFSLAAACATALLFGLGPAMHRTRGQYTHAIAEATGAATSGLSLFSRQRGRSVLVVAQLAMATALLIGAGLLIRSFIELANVDTGYEPNDVLTFQAVLPPGRIDDPRRPVFANELTGRLRDLPRVQLAGFTNLQPLTTGRFVLSFTIPGVSPEVMAAMAAADRPQTRYVSQNYLRAIGVRLVEGRWFGDRDDATGAKVVLVNQALARRFFGDKSPIGTFVTLGGAPWEIIGVVGDVRQGGLDADAEPQWFIDFRQLTDYVPVTPAAGGVFFAVRTSDDPVAMVSSIRALARQIESQATLDNVYALDALVSTALARPRFYAILMGLFASAAAALAAIGIYGVLAYAVARRTREIGIRMALGAPRRRVLWLVLGQGAGLTLTGILIGVAGAVVLTRSLRTLLFGLTPLDPPTFVGVSIAFAAIATLACYVPARRAMAVDPLTALREE